MPAPSHEVPIDDVTFTRRDKIADYAPPAYFADDGMTHEEIAAAIAAEEGTAPLSVERIRQIERDALRKLRRMMLLRGILKPDDVVPW
ncbi:MAG TPA: hypothetical protein GX403_17795 [Rhodocyclaceae bacterium]|nr:hypothetical protein [Rhodocyclaceae bacterium]